jgi:hypothetical protein
MLDRGEIPEPIECSPCYYPERFLLILHRAQMNPSLLLKPLPCKAYHDESLLRSCVMDAVPLALIVFAVLFWHSAVSLLDR